MIFQRLKDLREDNDLTQQQVADLLYVNRRTYSSYETGARSMSPEMLIKIAEIYKVSVDYLLGVTNQKNTYPKK